MRLLVALLLAAGTPAPTPPLVHSGVKDSAPTLPAAPAWPGPKSVTAKAGLGEVKLGQPFIVTVDIRHEPGETWRLKDGQKLDPFKLRSQSSVNPNHSQEVTVLSLELALFQFGSHAVPDLALIAERPGEPPHELSIPGPTVKASFDLGKDRDKRDIRPPVALRVLSLRLLGLVVAVLALVLAAILAIRLWRRRPHKEKRVATPAIPEDQLALTALTALESEGLPGRGRFKDFHLRLSEILRHYLTARFGILALDMTSEELYEALGRLPTEGLSLADLHWVCAQGDLAKFAKGTPSIDDCKQALQLVRQLVVRTHRLPLGETDAAGSPGVAA